MVLFYPGAEVIGGAQAFLRTRNVLFRGFAMHRQAPGQIARHAAAPGKQHVAQRVLCVFIAAVGQRLKQA